MKRCGWHAFCFETWRHSGIHLKGAVQTMTRFAAQQQCESFPAHQQTRQSEERNVKVKPTARCLRTWMTWVLPVKRTCLLMEERPIRKAPQQALKAGSAVISSARWWIYCDSLGVGVKPIKSFFLKLTLKFISSWLLLFFPQFTFLFSYYLPVPIWL